MLTHRHQYWLHHRNWTAKGPFWVMCTLKPALDTLLQVRLQSSPGYLALIPHLLLAWDPHSRFPRWRDQCSCDSSKDMWSGKRAAAGGSASEIRDCCLILAQSLGKKKSQETGFLRWLLITNPYFYSECPPLSCSTVSFTNSILLSHLPTCPSPQPDSHFPFSVKYKQEANQHREA